MDYRALRGIGMMIGAMYALDAFSAFMSSPWSTEAFSEGDERKAKSARRLVYLSMGTSVAIGGTASWLDRNPWPLIGTSGMAAFMWFLYEDALRRGQENAENGGSSVVNANTKMGGSSVADDIGAHVVIDGMTGAMFA